MSKEIKLSTTKLDPIPENFKLFYCTFGYGQGNSGCVQPIYAKSINDAQKIMFELYGGQWLIPIKNLIVISLFSITRNCQ